MGPPTCRVVVVKSMLSLFGDFDGIQLVVSKQSRITHGFDFAANSPRRMEFLDESFNVSSPGRSATADITRPPAVIKMTPFVNL